MEIEYVIKNNRPLANCLLIYDGEYITFFSYITPMFKYDSTTKTITRTSEARTNTTVRQLKVAFEQLGFDVDIDMFYKAKKLKLSNTGTNVVEVHLA